MKMRAAVLAGPRRIEIRDLPEPQPGAGEVLVRIRASAICGSDVHGFRGEVPQRRPLGLVMGHEAAGEIVGVGSGVPDDLIGTRVAIDPQISCGRCASCRAGWRSVCDEMIVVGSAMRTFRHGTNAQFLAIRAENAHPLPDSVGFAHGALAEPAGNAVHAVRRVGVTEGSSVVVVGAGAVGLIVIQALRALGAGLIVAVDIAPKKLALARGFGATAAIDSTVDDPIAVVLDATDGAGVDVAIECVGLNETYRQAVAVLRKRGRLAALGFVDESISFAMRPLIFRELEIFGSTGFHWPDDDAIGMLARGEIDVGPLITHRVPLEEAQRGYEIADSGDAIKVILVDDDH